MLDSLPQQSISNFHVSFLSKVLSGIKLNRYVENFDHIRFPEDSGIRPNVYEPLTSAQNLHWYFQNIESVYNAYSSLTDEKSKALYLEVLAYRIGGHLSFKIPTNFCEDENNESWVEFNKVVRSVASKFDSTFPGMRHYDFEFDGKNYICDCFSMKEYLHRKQYYYEDGDLRISPDKGDVVLDCGACLGDTAVIFGHSVGEQGHVYSFDPVLDHLTILEHNIMQNPNLNITKVPCGTSNKIVEAQPVSLEKINPGFNAFGQYHIPTTTIDYFAESNNLNKVDFIKMDVEGAEISSLQGATQTILRFKPKLAISIYHHFDDYQSIINHIKSLGIYKNMVIGHYTIHREETVLYCS
jgi:FkbM family methyltransferase